MADKRISQLTDRGTIANSDVVPIVVSGAVTTNKATISSIQTFMQGNLDLGVTSVGITLGSAGTDVSVSGSPITSSGNITINLPTASATNRGLLSSANWTTFNNKVSSVGLSMPSAFTVSNSPITSSGTIAVTGAGTVSQYVRGDGSLADFPQGGGGGGASVSYYLNLSVSQGSIGGIGYSQMSRVPVFGAGTDTGIASNGYIASFITDAGDPALLEIPAGNWNFETYFSASSSGGSPTFYIELYKVNSGGTATLIASNSATPELISLGTNINPYFSALAVPTTSLTLTDRLAIRIYVANSGRTITLHTENSHLCQIITTFTTGLTALNGLTAQVQNFATGSSGTDFTISSASTTHTFNLPDASTTARGLITTGSQTIGGLKTFQNHILANDFFYVREQNASTLLPNYTQIYANSTHFGFNNGAGTGSAVFTYNGSRNYTLPSASGTLALTSDLGSYVPYSGATGGVDLGTHSLSANNLTANGGTNAGRLELKNASNASLIRTGYFVLSPSSNNTTIHFGFSTGASTWKNFSFSSHLIPDNTITIFSLPSAGGTLAVTTDLGAYLPLAGGTLTGGLNGTSASFTEGVTGQRMTILADSVGVVLQGYVGDALRIAVLGSGYNSGARGGLLASYGDFSSSVIANGVMSLGNDGTFGANYKTLGLTGNTTGTHRIFAGTSDDFFFAAATGRGFEFRANGGGVANLYIASTGAATFSSSAFNVATFNSTFGQMAISFANSGTTFSQIGSGISVCSTAAVDDLGLGTAGLNKNIVFATGTGFTERMRITSGGHVLINRTNISSAALAGSATLQVNNEFISTGTNAGLFWENRSGGVTTNSNWYGWYTTLGTIFLYNGSANAASINPSTGIYTPLSDENKKKDFEESKIGLNEVLKLKPTLYRMKDDESDGEKELGFIAQEVKEFIPQAYVESGEDDGKFIGLNYNAIVAALVKSVQEQQEQINQLKNQIK